MIVKLVDEFDLDVDFFDEVDAILAAGEDDLVIVEHHPGQVENLYAATISLVPPSDLKVLVLEPVTSSNVLAVGHLDDLLAVEFKGGSVYVYRDVTPDTIEGLNAAISVGSYLASRVKPQFANERIN